MTDRFEGRNLTILKYRGQDEGAYILIEIQALERKQLIFISCCRTSENYEL